MATLSLTVGNCGRGRNSEDLTSEFVPNLSLGSVFLTKRLYGLNLNDLEGPKVRTRKKFRVGAEIKKWKKHDYPWPGDIDPNTKTPLKYLSFFKPLDEKPKPVTLAFEKPLVDLEKQLIEVSCLQMMFGYSQLKCTMTIINGYICRYMYVLLT